MNSSLNKLAIVGFGSQAKAWALNLRDSKKSFSIFLRANSTNYSNAQNLGFDIKEIGNDISDFKNLILLIPDHQQLSFIEENKNFFNKGTHFIFAHGYAVTRYDLINKFPDFEFSLLAPKAIASDVRFQYETKGKIGAAIFFSHTHNEITLKELAKNLGFTALYPNSFRDEMIADLFSEQSILCSILPYASLKSFQFLVDKGISPELAFMECYIELKSISAAFVNIGPEDFFKMISPNALLGSEIGYQAFFNQETDKKYEELFQNIISQNFYKQVDSKTDETRKIVMERWNKELLTSTYKKLKNELIP